MDPDKKRLIASERDPDQRQEWWEAVSQVAPDQLVFVDECGSNISLTPRYGRAPRGERCVGQLPRNWGQNSSLLAAMTPAGITAALVVEGATDRTVFDLYVEQLLAPTLRPGQVVVWDNLSVHKSTYAREVVEQCGCRVVFLPPYSPDFNPIEQAFSKLKGYLRRANERTQDRLWDAIGAGLKQISAADAQGWYQHCGYQLSHHSL